jgi:hypothetical protein
MGRGRSVVVGDCGSFQIRLDYFLDKFEIEKRLKRDSTSAAVHLKVCSDENLVYVTDNSVPLFLNQPARPHSVPAIYLCSRETVQRKLHTKLAQRGICWQHRRKLLIPVGATINHRNASQFWVHLSPWPAGALPTIQCYPYRVGRLGDVASLGCDSLAASGRLVATNLWASEHPFGCCCPCCCKTSHKSDGVEDAAALMVWSCVEIDSQKGHWGPGLTYSAAV